MTWWPCRPGGTTYVSRGLNLGLDLKGGMHLILQVDMDQAVNNAWTALPGTEALPTGKRV